MAKCVKTPSYRLHRASGLACVDLSGRTVYLGKHGTRESRDAYDAAVGEWLAAGRAAPQADTPLGLTCVELADRYMQHAAIYYRRADGVPTSEVYNVGQALKVLRELYGRTECTAFGPLSLASVRERMVKHGWSRGNVNKAVGRIVRAFRWGVQRELVPASVYESLRTLEGLKRGRSLAPEGRKVRPVPDEHVAAIEPYVSRQVWALVRLMELTGMRAGEAVSMRGRNLDTRGTVWEYRPEHHKGEHREHERIVDLGPRAVAVLKPFLRDNLDAPLFSPADAEAERRAALTARRTTRTSCGNRVGSNRRRKPKRTPGDMFSVGSLRRAIQDGCRKAGVPLWHPHQLRHTFATRIRREHGLELARVLCGHKSVAVTEGWYAEVDRTKARQLLLEIG